MLLIGRSKDLWKITWIFSLFSIDKLSFPPFFNLQLQAVQYEKNLMFVESVELYTVAFSYGWNHDKVPLIPIPPHSQEPTPESVETDPENFIMCTPGASANLTEVAVYFD